MKIRWTALAMHQQQRYKMQSKFLEKSRTSKSSDGQPHPISTLFVQSMQFVPRAFSTYSQSKALCHISEDSNLLQRNCRYAKHRRRQASTVAIYSVEWDGNVVIPCGFERESQCINLPSHRTCYSSVSVVMKLRTVQTGELSFLVPSGGKSNSLLHLAPHYRPG